MNAIITALSFAVTPFISTTSIGAANDYEAQFFGDVKFVILNDLFVAT